MVNYYVKRTGQALVTLYGVITLSFVIIRMLPGSPMALLRAQLLRQNPDASPKEINQIVNSYFNVNPSEPLFLQYLTYISSILQGDFGQSMWYNKPVFELLAPALPWTLFLMSIATFLTFFLGIGLGAIMAYTEGSRFDSGMTILGMFLNSVPYYLTAVVMLMVFAFHFELLPYSGYMDQETTPGVNLPFITGVIKHAMIPILSVVITGLWGAALTMRGNSISEIGSDYARVGRLRGLPNSLISFRYVGRNAILPMYTSFMIGIGQIFGGSVILEQIFLYKGVGFYLIQAFKARDYPLMMAGFLLVTSVVLLGIYIADLTYGLLDPRVSTGGEGHESF